MCISFSRADSGLCTHQLFAWSNLSFSHNYYYYYYYYNYNNNYYIIFQNFSHQPQLIFFHWSLSISKSPKVSRPLLNILVVLNTAVFWMVSTRPLTSKSSRPFNNPLVIVPKHRSQWVQSSLSCSIVFSIL